MNKNTAEKIRAELEVATRAIAAKYGVVYVPQRGTFSSTDYNFKASFKDLVKPADGVGHAQTAAVIKMAERCNFDPSKKIVYQGVSYTLTDYNGRAHRFPWIATNDLGQVVRFPDETLERFCRITQPAA